MIPVNIIETLTPLATIVIASPAENVLPGTVTLLIAQRDLPASEATHV